MIVEFLVDSDYDFPLDMLRVDKCWPATTADAEQMLKATVPKYKRFQKWKRIKIRLQSDQVEAPSIEAWHHAGWAVHPDIIRYERPS